MPPRFRNLKISRFHLDFKTKISVLKFKDTADNRDTTDTMSKNPFTISMLLKV